MQSLEFVSEMWRSRLHPELENALTSTRGQLQQFLLSDSPGSIVAIDHFRKEIVSRNGNLGPSIAVDRFVLGKGEPPEAYHTKVGGVPYRPRLQTWPCDESGDPMVFLAQFCFTDSHDYISGLPGDILLVFIRAFRSFLTNKLIPDPCDSQDALLVEWYPISLNDLIQESDIPPPPFTVPNRYGVRFRSLDFLDESRIEEVRRSVPNQLLPQNDFMANATLSALLRHPGMKIGGAPYAFGVESGNAKGRLVASFGGVNAIPQFPYPWVNQSVPLSLQDSTSEDNYFDVRDGFCIHLFIDDRGNTTWEGSFL